MHLGLQDWHAIQRYHSRRIFWGFKEGPDKEIYTHVETGLFRVFNKCIDITDASPRFISKILANYGEPQTQAANAVKAVIDTMQAQNASALERESMQKSLMSLSVDELQPEIRAVVMISMITEALDEKTLTAEDAKHLVKADCLSSWPTRWRTACRALNTVKCRKTFKLAMRGMMETADKGATNTQSEGSLWEERIRTTIRMNRSATNLAETLYRIQQACSFLDDYVRLDADELMRRELQSNPGEEVTSLMRMARIASTKLDMDLLIQAAETDRLNERERHRDTIGTRNRKSDSMRRKETRICKDWERGNCTYSPCKFRHGVGRRDRSRTPPRPRRARSRSAETHRVQERRRRSPDRRTSRSFKDRRDGGKDPRLTGQWGPVHPQRQRRFANDQ
jgi:hypothetical protein